MGGSKMLPVVLVLAMALIASQCNGQNTNEQNHICNGNRMPDFNSEQATISAINDVVAHTSDPGYHRKTSRTISGKTGWAIGACNGVINVAACNRCMTAAHDKLRGYCVASIGVTNYAVGAQIHLVDCRLRWETYNFDW